ncbi:MAG TPA: hypothetical protein VKP67_24250 [Xanthobacteraceae bacterium]|nr:hypothetical protein [Xanthobacteraceae bacterium]
MNTADLRIIGSVGLAHFVSHFNVMILPPLFAIVREDFGVTYTELGLALVAFNIVSGVLQVPLGFDGADDRMHTQDTMTRDYLVQILRRPPPNGR